MKLKCKKRRKIRKWFKNYKIITNLKNKLLDYALNSFLILATLVRTSSTTPSEKKTPFGVFFASEGKRSACALRVRDSKAGAMCERSEHREARPERLVNAVAWARSAFTRQARLSDVWPDPSPRAKKKIQRKLDFN